MAYESITFQKEVKIHRAEKLSKGVSYIFEEKGDVSSCINLDEKDSEELNQGKSIDELAGEVMVLEFKTKKVDDYFGKEGDKYNDLRLLNLYDIQKKIYHVDGTAPIFDRIYQARALQVLPEGMTRVMGKHSSHNNIRINLTKEEYNQLGALHQNLMLRFSASLKETG